MPYFIIANLPTHPHPDHRPGLYLLFSHNPYTTGVYNMFFIVVMVIRITTQFVYFAHEIGIGTPITTATTDLITCK